MNRLPSRAGSSGVMPCGCCQHDGTYGVVWNPTTGEPSTCPNCNGTGSTDPDYMPRFKAYTITPTSVGQTYLAASAQLSGQVSVDANYDFCAIWLTASSTSLLANVLGGGFQIQLWDSGRQRPWQDAYVNIANLAGTGQRPFPLGLVPQRIPANWNIPWDILETSAVNNVIQVVISGYEMVPIVNTSTSS